MFNPTRLICLEDGKVLEALVSFGLHYETQMTVGVFH